jgi:hypothetical protein
MSEPSAPRRILHLVIEGFSPDQLAEVAKPVPGSAAIVEIFPLSEGNAREALEKIFAADTVAVWGKLTE